MYGFMVESSPTDSHSLAGENQSEEIYCNKTLQWYDVVINDFHIFVPLKFIVMKKLLLLFLLPALFLACSKNDEPEPEPEQGYTSFIIQGVISKGFIDSRIGYYDESGKSVLLMELGTLEPLVDSKEFIMPEYHEIIYLFYDVSYRLEKPFRPKKNRKNVFVLAPDERGIDASENFPH
jgi:hypothetical protein